MTSRALLATAFIGVLWAFVGVERIVGDHEVGVSWEPFVKHRPSLQMRFTNPAQFGLDVVPFEDLSPTEQIQFMEFCEIRFGATAHQACYALIADRQV